MRLGHVMGEGHVIYPCARCGGSALGIAAVRRMVDADTFAVLWSAATVPNVERRVGCSACGRPSVAVSLGGQTHFTIDVCIRCHLVWFDRHEVDQLQDLASAPPIDREPRRGPPAVANFRPHYAEPVAPAQMTVENPWGVVAAALGFALDADAVVGSRFTGVWYLAGAILTGTILGSSDAVVAALGLVAADPLRLAGLPWLLAPLLQPSAPWGMLHLYLFVLIAHNLGQHLGATRLYLLIVLAALGGQLGHVIVEAEMTEPLVGIEVVLTALATAIAPTMWRMRLHVIAENRRPWDWVVLPGWMVGGLWLLLEAVDIAAGFSRHGVTAHVVAVALGVLAWWTWHERLRRWPRHHAR